MKIYVRNNNTCTRVKLFGEDVINNFSANGHEIVTESHDADYIIINTCSFLKSKEEYFLDVLRKQNAELENGQKIVVIGCLASVNKPAIEEISKDIICFGRDIEEIRAFFDLKIAVKSKATQVVDKLPFKKRMLYIFNKCFLHSKHIEYRLKRNKVCYLQISTGCRGNCAYCSEKFTTKLKSRTIDEILEAINDGLSRGYNLFALNSDDASAYGKDIGSSLEELLEKVVMMPQKFYITIPEFNPHGISERVQELLADKKFLYITVPIQSGSQKILDLMNRPYKIEEVLPKLREIKKKNKKLKINTHVIVGFPGETEEDFLMTKNVLKTGIFDRVKVFKFSERPNTLAITLPDKVDQKTKDERANTLLKVIKKNNIRHFSLTNIILNKEQIK